MATRAIHTLHWDWVTGGIVRLESDEALLVMWPAPMDADICFRDAGFVDFADSDETWDSEWTDVIRCVVVHMSQYGSARMLEAIEATDQQPPSFLGRLFQRSPATHGISLGVVEQLNIASMNDQFPRAVAGFGDPPVAILTVSRGHCLLQIQLPHVGTTDADHLLTTVADGRHIAHTPLDWKLLLP